MFDFSQAGDVIIVALFLVSAVIIAWAGTRATHIADRLADTTGLGEAIVGAVFLGGCTSISGSVTSVAAAVDGYPSLAISNAFGGIAAQTAFLAFGDLIYRKSNLEHAAASVPNLTYGTILLVILGFHVIGFSTATVSVFNIHPISIIIFATYLYGLHLARRSHQWPMWGPKHTGKTVEDRPNIERMKMDRTGNLLFRFSIYIMITIAAGYLIAKTGIQIALRTGISETFVGGFLTAVVTSLPELITTLAAIRVGALTLAVGGVIGGNTFDTLFVAFSDVAYREGSIYEPAGSNEVYLLGLTVLLTAILLLGMIQREEHGIANIGFESFWILSIYFLGFFLLALL